jgi:DNA polymerase III delta subunit
MAASATQKPAHWTRQTLPRLLVVMGPETALREEAIAAAKALATDVVTRYGPQTANQPDALTPADVLDEACTASMFASDDEFKLVLVRQADLFLADKDWREIIERNVERIPETTTVLLDAAAAGSLKSTNFYKGLVARKAVVECASLAGQYGRTEELEAEVDRRARARGLALSHGALLALIGRSAKNLGVIEEELEKLALAFRPATEREAPPTSISEENVEETCAATNTFSAFNFADAIVERDAKRCLEVLGGIFGRGMTDARAGKLVTNESSITMMLLGALSYRLMQLQDVQAALDTGRPERDVYREMKLFGPRENDVRRALRKHTSASLRASMDALLQAYLDLRLSGLSAQEVLERMVWAMVKA